MEKPLSRLAEAVKASSTLAIDAMYKQMLEQGKDVIGFGAGEPDFNTPDNVKTAAIDAINANFTRYTPAAGIEALRSAICSNLRADYGLEYTPSQIVVSSGAKHNLFLTMLALCNPGDEVILPAPYWVSYYEQIRMAGGIPVTPHTDEAGLFKLSPEALEAAVSEKTKLFILNNPSNPTGTVYTGAELAALAEVCVKHGIYVISDEIYDKLVYDNLHFVSFPSLSDAVKDLTILIGGVSKSYSMTGWRVGFAAAPPRIAKVMANYQSHSTSSPSSISQKAALEALTGPQDGVAAMARTFAERRDLFLEKAAGLRGVHCVKPEGAFYIMMNVSGWFGKTLCGQAINTADDFAAVLLREQGVAVVPCEGFGAPEYLRWSYATSEKNLAEGLDRLGALVGREDRNY